MLKADDTLYAGYEDMFPWLRSEYALHGFVKFDLLTTDTAEAWANAIIEGFLNGYGRHVRRIATGEDNFTIERHYDVMDRFDLRHVLPIEWLYEDLPAVLSSITGRSVRTSPYERSAFVAKVYDSGGEQGWHTDTNSLTALLYLTTNEDGATAIKRADDSLVHIFPEAGHLLVLDGKNRWHAAETVHSKPKIVIPMNYYFRDEPMERPDGLDDVLYGITGQ